MGRPEEVVVQLVRDAARGELTVITGEARTSSDAAAEAAEVASWLQELDDPARLGGSDGQVGSLAVVRAQTDSAGDGRDRQAGGVAHRSGGAAVRGHTC